MKISTKVLTGLLLITAVGVGIAGAQDVTTSTTSTNASAIHTGARFENLKKLKNLSADVKAQLETARKNKDFAQVKSILEANGITMPKFEKLLDKKTAKQAKKTARKENHAAFEKLSDEVKAQLKEAFKARDMAKVKSILEANGITTPAAQSSTSA